MLSNYLILKTFENRGYSKEFLENINLSAHRPLKDVDAFCSRLKRIRDDNLHLVLMSDFDTDGIASGIIGFAGLSELGFRVSLYVPDHTDGYGIYPKTVARMLALYPDADVILTSDVGITANDAVIAANQCGIEVLITDHHTPSDKNPLPAAAVVIDPCRTDDPYENKSICGAYVLYQCLQEFADLYCDRRVQEQIRRLRLFAGLGTISDGMDLFHENRQLVRDAVSIARMVYANNTSFVVENIQGCDVYRRAFRGFHAVLHMYASLGKIGSTNDIDEEFFAFYLAPLFNCVKRLGNSGDMNRAFGVFFGAQVDDDVSFLCNLNNERKRMSQEYTAEIKKGVADGTQALAPFVYFSDAPGGILGLLAQQMMGSTGMPCVVLRNSSGMLHGSGRSPIWYPFMERARAAGFKADGHAGAFGIKVGTQAEAVRLAEFVKQDSERILSGIDLSMFERKPDFVIAHDGTGDTVIDIVLFLEYMEELKRLKPFGSGFPSPDVLLKFKACDGEWRTMGSTNQHLKIQLDHGFQVVCFNQAPLFSRKDSEVECRVWGQLGINEYRGIQTVQFIGTMESSDGRSDKDMPDIGME